MNKDKLQAEILAKIKEGVKPSDLKKPRLNKTAKNKPSQAKEQKQSVYVNKPKDDRRLSDFDKSDNGYESSGSDKSIPIAPALPNQNLLDQISSLKKQLQLYKDFREGDLKVKESYKETITDLTIKLQEQDKTITELKNQSKSTTSIKSEPTETKTFTCSDCQQAKPQSELSRIFGSFLFCLNCSKKARQTATQQKQKPQPVDFICHLCEQNKTEIPHLIKLDQTLTEYLICNSCKPTAKEFNEAELITDELWEKYPYSSASEILELEFGIKSRKE